MRIFYALVVYALIFCHNSFAATLDVATPADNSTQIAVDTDIELTFSSFTANSGNVTLKKKLDDRLLELQSEIDLKNERIKNFEEFELDVTQQIKVLQEYMQQKDELIKQLMDRVDKLESK